MRRGTSRFRDVIKRSTNSFTIFLASPKSSPKMLVPEWPVYTYSETLSVVDVLPYTPMMAETCVYRLFCPFTSVGEEIRDRTFRGFHFFFCLFPPRTGSTNGCTSSVYLRFLFIFAEIGNVVERCWMCEALAPVIGGRFRLSYSGKGGGRNTSFFLFGFTTASRSTNSVVSLFRGGNSFRGWDSIGGDRKLVVTFGFFWDFFCGSG